MKDATFVGGGAILALFIILGTLYDGQPEAATAPLTSAAESQQPGTLPAPSLATTAPRGEASSAAPTTPPAATAKTAAPRSSKGAAVALETLEVTARTKRGDYDRDAFGSSWSDTDGNGCNQRDDVLLRDAVPGSVKLGHQGRCDHDVLAGEWLDPYSGRRIVLTDAKAPAQSQAVQIDHVVPLGEAWSSGGWVWSDDRRRDFANDLDVLLAVDGPTNASKSDDDPAAWRPRKAFQCEYAERWIAVKAAWDLAVDQPEKRALVEMLAYC